MRSGARYLRSSLLAGGVLALAVGLLLISVCRRSRTARVDEIAPVPPARSAPAPRTAETPALSAPDAVAPQPANAPVLPLEAQSLESLQLANGKAVDALWASHPGWSPHVVSAVALREALVSLGHDPEQTLMYWLSDDFQRAVAAGNPSEAVDRRRQADSLLAVALGDAGSDEDFAAILDSYSAVLRDAAVQRRARRP